MNEELQLKLQAYLDGELTDREAEAVGNLLARDSAAQSLLVELTNTREALVAHESACKVPDSREFYWSKIQRQIHGEAKATAIARPRVSLSVWLSRALLPTGAAAALIIAVMLSLPHGASGLSDVSFTSGDSAAFTYHDYATGTTLVWLDSDEENSFPDFDTDDTLDL